MQSEFYRDLRGFIALVERMGALRRIEGAAQAGFVAVHERGPHRAHRDGRRLWATATFSQVEDPDTGRHVTVGTFRDVTAEHNAIQRDSALAALSLRLSQATDLSDALQGALHFYNRIGGPDFTARDVRLAEELQPHFHVALSRVLAHEEAPMRTR